MISVLFVEDRSIYKQLPVDAWDQHRDALNFAGDNVVIAHPPCRTWSRLKGLSTAPSEERYLSLRAIDIVQKNGGILEHPFASSLWKEPQLKKTGFLFSVDQHWWGHPCQKKTILYICGIDRSQLPAVPLNFDCPEKLVDCSRKQKGRRSGRHLPVSQRNKTPLLFARWLIDVAGIIEKQNLNIQWTSTILKTSEHS